MGLTSKIAGPRVLLGVSVAAVAALLLMFWLLGQAREEAAIADQQAAQLRHSLEQQASEYEQLRARQRSREQAVEQALEARDRARQQAEAATQQMEEALADDDCANTDHPDAVARGLRFPGTGGAHGD